MSQKMEADDKESRMRKVEHISKKESMQQKVLVVDRKWWDQSLGLLWREASEMKKAVGYMFSKTCSYSLL